MPAIYKFEAHKYTPKKWIVGERKNKSKAYFNPQQEKYGNGFGGVAQLFKTGFDLVKNNKDLIIEGGKAAGSVASAVSKVSDAVKADKQLKEIELIRKLRQEAEAKKISNKTKEKIEALAQGDGIAKF